MIGHHKLVTNLHRKGGRRLLQAYTLGNVIGRVTGVVFVRGHNELVQRGLGPIFGSGFTG